MDDHVSVIGDWLPPDPSPRTFFNSILGDDFASRSFSELLGDNEHHHGIPLASSEKINEPVKGDDDAISGDRSNSFSIQKPNSYKSLAERMAARAGFNAPTVNTTRTNLSSPEVRSPYLTIPPGLSPTTLLDSPVFLSSSLIQPSPTTGKFSFDPSNGKSSMFPEASARDKDNGFEDVNTSLFAFKPHVEVNPSHFCCTSNKETTGNNPKQKFPNIEVSVQSECSPQLRSPEATEGHPQNLESFHHWAELLRSSTEGNTDGNHQFADPVTANDEGSPELDDQQDAEGDQRSCGEFNSTIVNGAASSEDGYCWRKYGQKQVKGSECPRSYYKCTHPNCQVKKKVERSHEGHITEIIYKGAHNHPKPPQNRRSSAVGSSNLQSDVQLDITGHGMTGSGVDSIWARFQGTVATGCPDQKHVSMNATSSASGRLELFDPSTSMQTEKAAHPEAANILDVSCTLSNDEDEDDRGTHGSVSLGCDGEGDETESKRRKIEATEMGGVARAIREPRVVVQTTSEVDILDDGYRWRKYGQKVVKGNPNPRSYYKCTNTGCTVRKHVERASHDLKSVITTYEGKHNHDVPAARNSNHVSSGASNTMPASAAQSRTRPDPYQVHENMTIFDGPVSLSSCMLPGRQQSRPLPGLSFRANQPGMSNLSMAGRQSEMLAMPAHLRQYLEQQQQQANEAESFMMPKGEPVYESTSELGPFLRHEKMNRLPLGPQTETKTHNGWSFHACI